MFANIKAIIELIKMVLAAYQFIAGQISEAAYNSKIKKIKEAAVKASNGTLEDRLEGGRDVEDIFNSHAAD